MPANVLEHLFGSMSLYQHMTVADDFEAIPGKMINHIQQKLISTYQE